MNRRGGLWLWVGIAFVILILAGLAGGGYYAYKKGLFDKKPAEQVQMIPFFLAVREANSQEIISGNYALEANGQIISQGRTAKDSLTELSVPVNSFPIMNCWSENHYLVRGGHAISGPERQANKSVGSCEMIPVGKLTVSHEGTLDPIEGSIVLILNASGWVYRPNICLAWTAGIIDVSQPEQIAVCQKGMWKNYSFHNTTSGAYTWLPPGQFTCDSYGSEKCDWVNTTRCKITPEEIPARFQGKADTCFAVGKNLYNEAHRVRLLVKTQENKNLFDKIDVFVFDKDRRFDTEKGSWEWVSSYNGEDPGIPPVNHTIYYDPSLAGIAGL